MKKRIYTPLFLRVLGDSLAVLASWFLAGYVRFYVMPEGRVASFGLFVQLSVVVLVMYIFFISRKNLYVEELEHSWRKETTKLVTAAFQAFLLLVIMLYFLFSDKVSRIAIALHFLFVIIFLVIERTYISSSIKKAYMKGNYTRHILLVGFGEKLSEYEKALHSKRTQGIKILGQYDGDLQQIAGCEQLSYPTLWDAVAATKPDLVVIGYPGQEYDRQEAMVAQALDLLNEKVVLLPSLPESYIGTQISDFRWIPMLRLNAAEIGFFQRVMKRMFDIVASAIGVLLLSPVLLIISFLIKVTSPGPVIYKQKRVTKDGKVFTMYKFRSMRSDIPEDATHWTEENDPRVTKIGRLIRRTSLDELPQLFNVIGGSMSLIGPRPERPELVEKFSHEIPGYRMRHRAKAGLSGWAQVNGWRGNTSLERRIEFDLYYIRNWSFFFDLKIVLFTFFRGFVNENAY
ncbi:undecaprenyl-phosphate glucose phosphotransferase [Sphaerochaeta sp. PS]|uniref:undecaprenyl-phosphate glucose phosphotransferase n=1 Tax=Sphaerochaeta sp. PS TaxID=3076336 RepID=UPI0028A2F600|nr:undecaprenyl-phosphate glucose phosphotransferase [Sphaerochaeta sp. PS]MDT4761985.1 undecaprenyl-phosphate glucose phosphotransferase [Sphaerochaeta sp. PS]